MFRSYLFLLLVLLLTGCAPVWGTYYRPSSEDAIEVRRCGGPVKEIAFEVGTGRLSLSVSDGPKKDSLYLRFTFEPDWAWEETISEKTGIPRSHFIRKSEQSTLNIKSDEVQVLVNGTTVKPILTEVSSFDYRTQRETQLPLLKTLELTTDATKNYSKQTIALFTYEIAIGDQKEFTVLIPDFLIDDVVQKGRNVHFIKSWKIWITPINGC